MSRSMRILSSWRMSAAVLVMLALGLPSIRAAGPGVSGRVFAVDEKGLITGIVPGAAIEFKDQSGKSPAKINADKNGYYQVELRPGSYVFKVTAEGFKDEDFGRGITLKRSDGFAIHNFSLTKGKTDPSQTPPPLPVVALGALQGRVLERLPNGQLVGIPGARVALRRPGQRLIEIVAQDAAGREPGRYEVVLQAGVYRAAAMAAGFETLVDPNPITIFTGATETRDFILTRIKRPEPTDQGIKGVISVWSPRGPAATPAIRVSIQSLSEPGLPPITFSPGEMGGYRQPLIPGIYRVTAEADGYRTASSGPRDVFVGRYTVVNLRLAPEPTRELTFVGAVFERIGERPRKPLPGATVLLRRPGEPLAAAMRGITDEQGIVRMKVSVPGRYQALARKQGFEPAGVPVEINVGGVNHADIELTKTETSGQIALDLRTVDGRDKSRMPLPGVQLLITQDGRSVASGTSDREGRAHFSLPGGTYRIDASRSGFLTAHINVVLTERDVSREIVMLRREIPPPPPGEKLTFDLLVKERESATSLMSLPNADIIISQQGKTIASGRSDGGGYFTTKLPAGNYKVDVSKRGYLPASFALNLAMENAERQVVLTRREAPPPPPGEKLTLDLLIKERGIGMRLASLPDAAVVISQQGRAVASGRSDGGGRFSAKLPPGGYKVDVTKRGYRSASFGLRLVAENVDREVVLEKSEGPKPPAGKLNLELAIVEQLRIGAFGPVSEAGVVISHEGRRVAAGHSDRAGLFTAELEPDTYLVSVSKMGYNSAALQVTLTTQDVKQRITMTRREGPKPPAENLALTLRVLEKTRMGMRPIPGADLVISQQGRSIVSGEAGRDGAYVARLPAGNYRVDVSQEGFVSANINVNLTAETTRDIVLTRREAPPPQGGALALTIRGAALRGQGLARPLPGAQIVITGPGGTRSGQSDAAGRYSVQLPSGQFHVKVTHPPDFRQADADVTISAGAVSREITLQRMQTIK